MIPVTTYDVGFYLLNVSFIISNIYNLFKNIKPPNWSTYIDCGDVNRGTAHKPRPFRYDLEPNLTSSRRTSHPCDFLLAVMPQYDFYQVPSNAKDMSFGELFLDCFQQGRRAGFNLHPLLTADGAVDIVCILRGTVPATDNVPEPACHGDFVKLFFGPRPLLDMESRGAVMSITKVDVQLLDTIDSGEAENIIYQSARRSRYLWNFGAITELSPNFGEEHINLLDPEQWNKSLDVEDERRLNVPVCVALLAENVSDMQPTEDRELVKDILQRRSIWIDSALRVSTLVTCGPGVCAFAWAKENLSLVQVKFREQMILAFLPKSVAYTANSSEFYVVEVEAIFKQRFALIARSASGLDFNSHELKSMGIFPLDISLIESFLTYNFSA